MGTPRDLRTETTFQPVWKYIQQYFNNQCAYQQLKFFQYIYLGSLCPGFQILKELRIQAFSIQRDFFQAFPAIPSLWGQEFCSFGWPWLVMLPSSGPKRGNYHWPGETISKIISCVASVRNHWQGADPVLQLEVSSREPLLWGLIICAQSHHQYFSDSLSNSDSHGESQHLGLTWRKHDSTQTAFKLSIKGVKIRTCSINKTPLVLGRHFCPSSNSLMVGLYIYTLACLPSSSIWIADFLSLLGAEKVWFWVLFVFHRPMSDLILNNLL